MTHPKVCSGEVCETSELLLQLIFILSLVLLTVTRLKS